MSEINYAFNLFLSRKTVVMEQTFGLHFFLRKSKKKNNQESMIFIRITVDGESRERINCAEY